MQKKQTDIVLVGAGIMSATLAAMLKELQPDMTVEIFEMLDSAAEESSNAWNNAGTGHAALCELNYTPQNPDGSVGIARALTVNTQFDLSQLFWAYMVRKGAMGDPDSFIHNVPHISFVWGDENVEFLRKRYDAMSAHHCFKGMEYSEDPSVLEQWMPLVMQGRDSAQRVAGTRMITGTDIDFGAVTRNLLAHLRSASKERPIRRPSTSPDRRWRLERFRKGRQERATAHALRQDRLSRGRRRRAEAPAEIRDRRRQRLRRLPGKRYFLAV